MKNFSPKCDTASNGGSSLFYKSIFSVGWSGAGELGTQDDASDYNIINQKWSYAMYYFLYFISTMENMDLNAVVFPVQ